MKLLLTSGGVSNPSIQNALVDLLGKPISECDALCIPTAEYGHPQCTPQSAWRFVSGITPAPMRARGLFSPTVELGWKSVGLLELTALPTMGADRWLPWVRAADVLLVDGGDATYLAYWMRESGLADLMPSLPDTVWVGVSAGSMVMTPGIGETFAHWKSPTGDNSTLGVVPFSIFPHLHHPMMPGNNMAAAEAWAARLGSECYAMDDQSAIRVTDGVVQVVSEGEWKRFNP